MNMMSDLEFMGILYHYGYSHRSIDRLLRWKQSGVST
jgi:hypothetical protein